MKIIDEITQQVITEPDLTAGELQNAVWASPEAYATIDNVTKHALDDDDYEEVQLYHVWTDDEIAQREAAEAEAAKREIMGALPDAVAELSEAVSDTAMNTADVMDAIAELSEIVSNLMEGE